MPYLFEFTYHNPTQIVFGPNSFAKLGSLVPAEARVLLLYGGGSIKGNGVYVKVIAALAGREVVEFAGVEPNPTLETLSAAVDLAKRQKIDFVLGVGGGLRGVTEVVEHTCREAGLHKSFSYQCVGAGA